MTPRSRGHGLAELSSARVVEHIRHRTLVWPVGAVEQHGPHLPLSVDLDIADALARQLSYELDGCVLPALPVGARSLPQSGGGAAFPGTVHVGGETLIRYLRETVESLLALPFARLLVVNGHYENEAFVFEALDAAARATGCDQELIAFSWWSLVGEEWLRERVARFPGWHAEHAGLTETSLMLYLRPDLVADLRPEHGTPPRAGLYLHPADTAATTNAGVLSSTSGASAELGEELFWHVVGEGVSLVRRGTGLLRETDPRSEREGHVHESTR